MKNLVFVSAFLGVSLLAWTGSPAIAVVVLPYDSGGFEGDSLGTVAAGNPAGWNAPGIPASASINVIGGSSTGGSGANAQVLDYNLGGSEDWNTAFNFDEEVDSILNIEFKVRVMTGSDDLRVNFLGFGSDGATSYVQLNARNNAPDAFVYYDGGFTTLLSDVVQGDWYQVNQTLDLANETYDITITNLDNPAQTVTSLGLGYSNLSGGSTNKMNRFGVFESHAINGLFQLDDVKVSVVPEPSSFGLLALVGLMFAGKRSGRLKVA